MYRLLGATAISLQAKVAGTNEALEIAESLLEYNPSSLGLTNAVAGMIETELFHWNTVDIHAVRALEESMSLAA